MWLAVQFVMHSSTLRTKLVTPRCAALARTLLYECLKTLRRHGAFCQLPGGCTQQTTFTSNRSHRRSMLTHPIAHSASTHLCPLLGPCVRGAARVSADISQMIGASVLVAARSSSTYSWPAELGGVRYELHKWVSVPMSTLSQDLWNILTETSVATLCRS